MQNKDILINDGGVEMKAKIWSNLNIPEELWEFIDKILSVVIIAVIMSLTIKLGVKVITKWTNKRVEKSNGEVSTAHTIETILKSTLKYTVFTFGALLIIANISNKSSSTIAVAFASVGGVAFGFGAQSLVKDIINGFFLLFEGQFSVGEHVEIEGASGIVESIELRVTRIRDFDGGLHIIPNGTINMVTNHSRGPKRILANVSIAYEEDIDRAINIINEACAEFAEGNEDVVTVPKVLGVSQFEASGVSIRVAGMVNPSTQGINENKLRKTIKEKLDEKKVEIPYEKVQLLNNN